MGYTSRIEWRPAETRQIDNAEAVKKEIRDALAAQGFQPVHPGAAVRTLTKQRGFWLGDCNITTSLSGNQDLIVVIINCQDTASRKEVRSIQEILQKVVADKFPTLTINVIADYDITAMPP